MAPKTLVYCLALLTLQATLLNASSSTTTSSNNSQLIMPIIAPQGLQNDDDAPPAVVETARPKQQPPMQPHAIPVPKKAPRHTDPNALIAASNAQASTHTRH